MLMPASRKRRVAPSNGNSKYVAASPVGDSNPCPDVPRALPRERPATEALASIDFATIVPLFSMMLLVANLRLAGFFERVAEWIIERRHPHHLLPTVIFTCGLLSAFLGSVWLWLSR